MLFNGNAITAITVCVIVLIAIAVIFLIIMILGVYLTGKRKKRMLKS